MHVAHSCLNQRRECLVDTRGSERLYLQAPLSRPPPRARGPAKQEKVGRALSRHARTVTVLLAVAPQWRQRQASQVKTRLEEKYCPTTVTVEPLHRLDLRLASSFFSFFPAASMFHLARVRIAHATEPSSHLSAQHSIRYRTRDLPGYEYTERQPPGST